MKNYFLLLILSLTQVTGHLALANAKACSSAVKSSSAQVHIYGVNSVIATPESLPQVKRAVAKLKKIISEAQNKNDIKSQIYNSSLEALNQTLTLGESILQNKASSQDEVFSFFYQFTKIIDLPKDYADKIAYYADGFDYMNGFTEKGFKERLKEFNEKFKTPKPLLDDLIKSILNPSKRAFHLTKSFKYISVAAGDSLPDDLTFSFQYRYIFKKGLLSFSDLFKDRESGKFYMGVSFKDFSPYDGQHGDSNSFLRHDYLHSYIQKYYDKLVFDEFNAHTNERQKELKKLTHQTLQKRYQEFLQISNPEFKSAVEILMFAILHDVGLSYPNGVHRYLSNTESRKRFIDSLTVSLSSGFYGKELAKLKIETVLQALDWLQTRSQEDDAFVRENFK